MVISPDLCIFSGAEFYIMQNFAFDRYAFKILTIERPKAELVALLEQKNYLNLCVISNFGETLWVEKSHMKTLDVSTLPSECRKI